MLCCAIGAAMIAFGATWRRWLGLWLCQHGVGGTAAAVAVAALATAGVLAFAAEHLGHYAERARASERSLLAEIISRPICAGSPAGDDAGTARTLHASLAARTTE